MRNLKTEYNSYKKDLIQNIRSNVTKFEKETGLCVRHIITEYSYDSLSITVKTDIDLLETEK